MTNEEIALYILNYSEKEYEMPIIDNVHKDLDKIKEVSYAQQACYSIIDKLMDCPFDNPLDIIDNYILQMEFYRHISGNKEVQKIFEIQRDTANEIMLTLV